MKKIVALSVLLLATSAFGAVTLTGPAEVKVDTLNAGDTFNVVLSLSTAGEAVTGFSLFPTTTATGLQMTARAIGAVAPIADPTKSDTALALPFTVAAAIDPSKDLGTGASDGVSAIGAVNAIPYLTLTFKSVNAGSTMVGKTLSFQNIGWADDQFGINPVADVVVQLTPEPISALLLGLGSLFLVRRRRA